MNKQAFFSAIRPDLFSKGPLPKQVYLIETLLDACDAADWPASYTAYALATAHHESASWTTLKEIGGEAYFKRMYDKAGSRPSIAKTLGNTEAGDGVKFAGRGYVQLTGRTNYQKAGKALGLDLLKEPDKAMEPSTAARILIWGMATGAYTGKACRDYLAKSPPDYIGARRIINGTDRANMIAGYAATFFKALEAAGYGVIEPAPVVPAIPPAEPLPIPARVEPVTTSAEPTPSQPGFFARFLTAFKKRTAA